MIPENLREKWELTQARTELLFLADNGGGYPDCIVGDGLTPNDRRVILRRMGFRVREEYDMPDPKDWYNPVRWPWLCLTNDVAVCLVDGFVARNRER